MTILGSPLYLLELNSSNPDNKYMQLLMIMSKLKLRTNFFRRAVEVVESGERKQQILQPVGKGTF